MSTGKFWHTLDTEQIATRLETDPVKGLSRKQAANRSKKLRIRQPDAVKPLFLPSDHPFYRFISKMLLDPIMLLTLTVAIISFFFEYHALGAATVAIILCHIVCCAFAGAKAANVWNTLQLYSNPMVKVIRGGKLYTTDARNIVPGDVVVLNCGDICPSDIRLDKGYCVRVKQYVFSTDHKNPYTCVMTNKCGDRVYMPDEDVHNPNCDNIVYAGSVIEEGFARGIAVETGRHTYVGAVNGTVPGTERDLEPDSIAFIRRYFMRFSTFQVVLLVPLTIIMTVTMRQSLSFAECFLTALSLCCTVIAEHIVAMSGIVRATGIDWAATQKENAAVAIVKNSKASDSLCEMTDLLLLDGAAISDGKYHIESVYTGGSIYDKQELLNGDVYRLASDLYLYRSAPRSLDTSGQDMFDACFSAPIDALIKYVGIDKAAIDLTRVSSHITYSSSLCEVNVQQKQSEYQVLLTCDDDILHHCTHIECGDHKKVFDDSEHIALRTLCRIYRESGYRILLVANRKNQNVTLMGVLAFASRPGFGFQNCCDELINSGVRISAFMPNTAESMKILTDCELVRDESNDVLTAERAEQEGLSLHVAYGSYRAYLGFSNEQITDLVDRLRNRGNRVATYCVNNASQAIHEKADLRITCDAIEYRSAKVAESLYDKMPLDGRPFSSRASQNTRRSSDIVLRRAGDQGGGLHGILTGIRSAFAINHNLANMMTYLVTVQFFRVVLVVLPALFGTYTLSAVSLLLLGLVLDAAAVILFAFATPNSLSASHAYPIMRRLEKTIAYNTANIASACVSAVVLWLCIALLQVFDVISGTQCEGLCFVATYLLQGTVFAVTLHEYTAVKRKIKFSPIMLGALISYLLLLIACVFIPGLNALTGGNEIVPISLLLTPIAALVYYFLYRILTARGLNLHK
ncbi:MAG: cation-transporting P-type ATPase [Clostridia bacterium]|nr:cation-transporting P-type ATPase [Clostridia bacterium]